MAGRTCRVLALSFLFLASTVAWAQAGSPQFATSAECIACHSNMVDGHGNAFSLGYTWRASMMALSAKDPYWMAGVRREIADRPHLQAEIEDTCSVCHMPMARTTFVAAGGSGEIVRYLENGFTPAELALAEDGVSCTVCHQISPENFGEHSSFGGGYVITPSTPGSGTLYGPYEIEAGMQRIMHSATTLAPGQGTHIQQSELCATCHTLFTPALDADERQSGEFPEQVPYLEWRNSSYAQTHSCQSCHMPEVQGTAQISSVLGGQRENVSRHVFRGGNVFMLTLLDRYREELGVTVPSADLAASAAETLAHLQGSTARIAVRSIRLGGAEASVEVEVENLTGHKLPTAYPSRRAWIHLRVTDQDGAVVFESGALQPDGSIAGSDNDADPTAFEPHYQSIVDAGQVQIYEPIVVDHAGNVTTSLLAAARYAKDNRLLPAGFDKSGAGDAVGVRGHASDDADFAGGGDRVAYRFRVGETVRSIAVEARLMYQTIGYRWASNLKGYDSFETKRFTRYYDENAGITAVELSSAVSGSGQATAALKPGNGS